MDRRRANADVTTKISRMDRLPNFLSNGAPLVRGAPLLGYISITYIAMWNTAVVVRHVC